MNTISDKILMIQKYSMFLEEPLLSNMESRSDSTFKPAFNSYSNKCCNKKSIITKCTDYLIIITLIILITVIQNTNGYHQYSNNNSPRLDYPIINDNTSIEITTLLMILFWCLFFIFNVIIIILYERKYNYNSISLTIIPLLIKFEILFRTYLFSFLFSKLTTIIIIKWVGRPTPNYHITHDNKSFPSLYTNKIFNINGLLTLYLLHSILNVRQILFTQKRNSNSGLLSHDIESMPQNNESYIHIKKLINAKMGDCYFGTYLWILTPMRYCMIIQLVLSLVPLVIAIYGSCNQLTHYKHFYNDVVVAALLGLVTALLSYCVHYNEFYAGKVKTVTK
eukprot:69732_1